MAVVTMCVAPSGPWRFRKILRPTASNGPQVGGEVAKRGAQAFLEHRVIERHRQRGLDRHAALYRPREQVRHVLHARAKHLGAQQPATRGVAVNPNEAPVPAGDARTALILEPRAADRVLSLGKISIARTDHCHLGVGEGYR